MMKKISTLGLIAITVFAFAAMLPTGQTLACDGTSKTTAKQASADKDYSCSSMKAKKATAKMTAESSCGSKKASAHTTATMASASGKADCSAAKQCMIDGKQCEMRTVSIKGMTCGGCEQAVTAALTKTPGVHKVEKVCYKSGTATVWVDPQEAKDDHLVKTVSNKGFQAEIMPAVAKTGATDSKAMKASGCDKPCPSTCAGKAKGAKASMTSSETKSAGCGAKGSN